MTPALPFGNILREPTAKQRFAIAATIAAASAFFLISTSLIYGRYLRPVWHDEFAYATQTEFVADGRLWFPPHEVGEFFETFYVLHQPKYAPIYFPGTAMMFAPSAALDVPLWIGEAVVAGLAVGLFYLVVGELMTPLLALFGAFLLLSLKYFQLMALMTMAQVPVLLLGLATIYAFLQWRKRQSHRWALAIGAFAGWAAITRPLDALCYAIPVGVAMLWELRRTTFSRRILMVATVILAALPFLTLQVVFNIGVTGSALQSPWEYYSERDAPGSTPGFRKFDPSWHIESDLPQKQVFYEQFIKRFLRTRDLEHLPNIIYSRARSLVVAGLPHWSLVVFAVLGLFNRKYRWHWLSTGAAMLFVVLYVAYPFTLTHYALSMAPAMVLLLLSGVDVLSRYKAGYARFAARSATAAIILLCLALQPGVARRVRSQELRFLRELDRSLATIDEPAVVLFTGTRRHDLPTEPVYNYRVSWPDDARVVRAHDLGDNRAIIRYYAEHQPQRHFYRFDEETRQLYYMGRAPELARM